MGNCFSSQRGTTGKLNDPSHGTGLTSLHSMQGGPLGVGVDQTVASNSVLEHLQGRCRIKVCTTNSFRLFDTNRSMFHL